jgi:Flp pilus assembly protein TadG
MSFFFTQVMETAVADASRLIMTGQVSSSNMTQAEFRNQVCNRLPPLFDCQSRILIDVQDYSTFTGASNGALTPGTEQRWNPGGPQDIVVARISFEMPVFMNFYGASLANHGSNYLITATSAFRNEPFVAPAGGGGA